MAQTACALLRAPCARRNVEFGILIKWTFVNFGVAYFFLTLLLVTMVLPLKKRKLSVPLAVKVDRLSKAVSRNKPDLQQYTLDAALNTNVGGYNETVIDLAPAGMLANVSGDFIVERVDYRVQLDTTGSFVRGRVDVMVPKKNAVLITTGSTSPNEMFSDKQIKSYHSSVWMAPTNSPFCCPSGSARLGLVVKREESVITANNPYLVLRYNTNGTSAVVGTICVRVHYREK